LIELIKKAGGIEELEKQISIQEDSSSSSGKSATTPATIINKSLVDKFKNRAQLFKSRPIFNGASQAERSEQKTSSSTSTQKAVASSSDEKPSSSLPKKYNAINRFSRPDAQNLGVSQIPESDAVLIEKPQYTSIQRRKPVKPEVIAENDYNNDSDRSSVENESKVSSSVNDAEVSKKYTSISRQRKPVVEVVEDSEEDEDEEEDFEEDEEITTKAAKITTKAPSKYISLSRRRSTTAAPEER
jgi:chitinase